MQACGFCAYRWSSRSDRSPLRVNERTLSHAQAARMPHEAQRAAFHGFRLPVTNTSTPQAMVITEHQIAMFREFLSVAPLTHHGRVRGGLF